jgi:hypothetical protein
MPLNTFIEEIKSFDRRLIETMGERVQGIRRSWDRPLIKIDKEALLREQQERANALAEAFQRVKNCKPTPWINIAKSIAYFEEQGFPLPKMTPSVDNAQW